MSHNARTTSSSLLSGYYPITAVYLVLRSAFVQFRLGTTAGLSRLVKLHWEHWSTIYSSIGVCAAAQQLHTYWYSAAVDVQIDIIRTGSYLSGTLQDTDMDPIGMDLLVDDL